MDTHYFSEDREEMFLHAEMLQRMAERMLKYAAELRERCEARAGLESRADTAESRRMPRNGVSGGGEKEGEIF